MNTDDIYIYIYIHTHNHTNIFKTSSIKKMKHIGIIDKKKCHCRIFEAMKAAL